GSLRCTGGRGADAQAVPGRGVWPGAAACAAQRAAAGTAAGGGRDHRRQSRRLPGSRVQRRGYRRRAVSPGSGTGADAGERAAVRRGMAGAFAMKITRLTTWHAPPRRSEEHTSELQSRENLVCRLLLEKKKRQP